MKYFQIEEMVTNLKWITWPWPRPIRVQFIFHLCQDPPMYQIWSAQLYPFHRQEGVPNSKSEPLIIMFVEFFSAPYLPNVMLSEWLCAELTMLVMYRIILSERSSKFQVSSKSVQRFPSCGGEIRSLPLLRKSQKNLQLCRSIDHIQLLIVLP